MGVGVFCCSEIQKFTYWEVDAMCTTLAAGCQPIGEGKRTLGTCLLHFDIRLKHLNVRIHVKI